MWVFNVAISEISRLTSPYAGDPEPSVDENKFTLLGFLFCPFCDRVRLTLNYHKIEYEQILVSLYDKPEWFTNLSPSGKVPLLLNRGDRLTESDLIMRFVDELRGPDASLLKVCGLEKFNEAAELSSKFFKPAHTILFKPSFDEQTAAAFREACEALCTVLKKDYFAGMLFHSALQLFLGQRPQQLSSYFSNLKPRMIVTEGQNGALILL
ncbi:glutathione S-transferase protein, partial [Opisthorchis viverrini]